VNSVYLPIQPGNRLEIIFCGNHILQILSIAFHNRLDSLGRSFFFGTMSGMLSTIKLSQERSRLPYDLFEIAHSPRLSLSASSSRPRGSSQAALSPALGHELGPNGVNKYFIEFMNRGTKFKDIK